MPRLRRQPDPEAEARPPRYGRREPIGLRREEAAAFLGVSASLFLRAVQDGFLPKPRRLYGCTIWLAHELEAAANRLPDEAGAVPLAPVDEDFDVWARYKA